MAGYVIMITLIFGVTVMSLPVSAHPLIPAGYRQVASQYGIPPDYLYSLALTESSRSLPFGQRPWPWTLNVAGKGYHYASRPEAWQALQHFLKTHPFKRIDIGIAQVNLGWNGHYFTSAWEALDPYINLHVAASILQTCRARTDSWLAATGCYHYPAGGKPAARYVERVKKHLAGLQTISGKTQKELS